MAPLDQAYLIYDHLEGEAKEEVKYLSQLECEDPEKILTILQELYGCSKSYVALQEEIFSRRQLEGESLQQFSHALLCLMEKAVKNAPGGMPISSFLLRDEFVEHVADPALRRELKVTVRNHSTCTLLDVRKEAIRWEREGMPCEPRGRSYSVPSISAMQGSTSQNRSGMTPAKPTSDELAELKAMLKQHQEQINQLSQSLLLLQNPTRHPPSYRQNPVICRRCQKPGHFARDCDNERVDSHSQRPPRFTSRSEASRFRQPAEN